MPTAYPTFACLGASKAGLTVGYRLDGSTDQAWTSAGIAETSIPGNYAPTAGTIPLPDGFVGRIVWGTASTDLAEEAVGPADSGAGGSFPSTAPDGWLTPDAFADGARDGFSLAESGLPKRAEAALWGDRTIDRTTGTLTCTTADCTLTYVGVGEPDPTTGTPPGYSVDSSVG